MALLETVKIPYDTPEWHAFRASGLGGSDAAAALGKSPYKTNVQLWEEKVGRRSAPDISGKNYVQYGKKSEEHLTALFALDYPQYEVIDTKDIIYKRGFLFASLDAELRERATGRRGFLEDKKAEIHSRAAAEKWQNDKIPELYYIQLLHYFLTTGFDFCKLKARLIDTDKFGEVSITETHRHYERAELMGDIKYLYAQECRFWRYVETKRRPPAILPSI
ncbi:MAG: lambda-exonuclease family protein [Oscillospiraceae bacterium]